MRSTRAHYALAVALALVILGLAGCTTATKVQPAPAAARDNKTPIALGRPMASARIQGQRLQDAQVARGKLAVEGQLK